MARRISQRYEEVEIIVKKAGSDGLSVLLAPDKDNAKAFVQETLQDAWENADDWFVQ
ncbi:DNA-damage-inducible protein I [Trabulsiella guamensis ATCC 49490]|uniref:DNA-damage-inducible protein I n=2 Tax=Trabulsiella guamensis TaxID=158852 RepID=A0A085A807_9ENTR|nr:DNA-damage-inducible protein I [Trabulsiella guamensis ATCC 49490]